VTVLPPPAQTLNKAVPQTRRFKVDRNILYVARILDMMWVRSMTFAGLLFGAAILSAAGETHFILNRETLDAASVALEAEAGVLGSDYVSTNDGTAQFISIQTSRGGISTQKILLYLDRFLMAIPLLCRLFARECECASVASPSSRSNWARKRLGCRRPSSR
jgi:hypothetical protein